MKTISNKELAIFTGRKIKELRLSKNMTQEDLARLIGTAKSTIANYEKGFRSPRQKLLFKLSNALSVSINELFPNKDVPEEISILSEKSIGQTILSVSEQLTYSRKQDVLVYAEDKLDEQKREQEFEDNSIDLFEINEPTPQYNVKGKGIIPIKPSKKSQRKLYVEYVIEKAAAGLGFGYTGNRTTRFYTDRSNLRMHDFSTQVEGDSMEPVIHYGDIICIKQTYDHPNGDIYVVDHDHVSYVKYVTLEDNKLILQSENPAYEDIILTVPNYGDEDSDGNDSEDYWNIVGKVVDHFTPINPDEI